MLGITLVYMKFFYLKNMYRNLFASNTKYKVFLYSTSIYNYTSTQKNCREIRENKKKQKKNKEKEEKKEKKREKKKEKKEERKEKRYK